MGITGDALIIQEERAVYGASYIVRDIIGAAYIVL